MSGGDGRWGMIWHVIGVVGEGALQFAAVLYCAADLHWACLGETEVSGHW